MSIHTKDEVAKQPAYPALARYVSFLANYFPPQDVSPYDDPTIHFLLHPEAVPAEIQSTVSRWNEIAVRHKPLFISEKPTGNLTLPIHPREYGTYENCQTYFGAMEGATRLAQLRQSHMRLEHGFEISVEPGEKHKYTSIIGVHIDIPWDKNDANYVHVRDLFQNSLDNVSEGMIPALLFDMDIDVIGKRVILYESVRHKFGWLWGVRKALRVPDADSNYGLPHSTIAESLASKDPKSADLYDAIGRKLRQTIGTTFTDFYRYSLHAAMQIAVEVLQDSPKQLWACSPLDILDLRGEHEQSLQVDLQPHDKALQSALKHNGTVQFRQIRNFRETRWYMIENPKIV